MTTNNSAMPGNEAQPELMLGSTRRHSAVGRRENVAPPRPLSFGESQTKTAILRDSSTPDPFTLGFERMMKRFDELESRMNANDRRLGKLRPRPWPDPEPPYNYPISRDPSWGCTFSSFKEQPRYTTNQQPHQQFRGQTCWDSPGSRNLPHQQPRYRDPPEQRFQLEVSAYKPHSPTCRSPPPQPLPTRRPTWEPPGQRAHLGAANGEGYYPWHDQQPPPQPLLDQQPPPCHRRPAVPPAAAAAPPLPLRSDCQQQHPAPLLAYTHHPRVAISSSRTKEWETNWHVGDENGLRDEAVTCMQEVSYIPNLKVQSLSPAQLAAINDYNDKLRVYRLEQAALLARLNAWFEENIDDENLAEENTDNTPTMVLGEDVPNNAAHNYDTTLDVPNDESLEEIVKNDNMSRQVLVEAYDDKIGDHVVPTHRELEIKDDVETLVEDYIVRYEDIPILTKSLANTNMGATNVNLKCWRSHIMYTCIIESWCGSSLHSLIHYQQRPCTFDPGGKLLLSTIFTASLFPP